MAIPANPMAITVHTTIQSGIVAILYRRFAFAKISAHSSGVLSSFT